MHKYGIVIYWSNEDQNFVVEVPGLSACMAHGNDQESASGKIKDGMRFRIETAGELGRPVPEPTVERLMPALPGSCNLRIVAYNCKYSSAGFAQRSGVEGIREKDRNGAYL